MTDKEKEIQEKIESGAPLQTREEVKAAIAHAIKRETGKEFEKQPASRAADILKELLGDNVLEKAIMSTTTGLPFFPFVLPEVTRVHPQDTPLVNELPRAKGQGQKVIWKMILDVRVPTTGTAELGAFNAVDTVYAEAEEPYKTIRADREITFQAVAVAANFLDLLATEMANGIIACKLAEERMVLQGDPSTDPYSFRGLGKFLDGVTPNYKDKAANASSPNDLDLTLDDLYNIFYSIYERGGIPKLVVVHPRLLNIITKLWINQLRPAFVVSNEGIAHPGTIVRGLPLYWNDIVVRIIASRYAPVRTVEVGGTEVTTTDVFVLDHDGRLPAGVVAPEERNIAIEIYDLIPLQHTFLAPVTLAHRLVTYEVSALAVRGVAFQGMIKNVRLPQL